MDLWHYASALANIIRAGQEIEKAIYGDNEKEELK